MKSKFFLSVILLMIAIIISGCNANSFQEKYSDMYFGVIETTRQKNTSYITFYDKELNKLGSKKLSYGSMGSSFDLPRVKSNSMYVIPKGVPGVKDLTIVLELDLITGKHYTYDLKNPSMNSLSIAGDIMYAVSTINGDSLLSKYQKDPYELRIKNRNKYFIGKIAFHYAKLFAFRFGDYMGSTKSYLDILDANKLSFERSIDITDQGMDQLDTILLENELYFTNSLKYIEGVGETESKTLSKLNLKTYEITSIELLEAYPYQINEYKGYLFISHYNLVKGEGSVISVYNPEQGVSTTYSFNHKVAQTAIKDNAMFISDSEKMYVYSIDINSDEPFTLQKQVNINTQKDNTLHFYVSGFFFKE